MISLVAAIRSRDRGGGAEGSKPRALATEYWASRNTDAGVKSRGLKTAGEAASTGSQEPREGQLAPLRRLGPAHKPKHDSDDADDCQDGDNDAHGFPFPTSCGAAEPVR